MLVLLVVALLFVITSLMLGLCGAHLAQQSLDREFYAGMAGPIEEQLSCSLSLADFHRISARACIYA